MARRVEAGRGAAGRGETGRSGMRGGRWLRRGTIGDLLLTALLDGPAHGYELMDRLEGFSGGNWRPSPGSVYPLLQTFEESRLIESRQADGRRVFTLTDAGRSQADERRADALATFQPLDSRHGMVRAETHRLQAASRQIVVSASPQQVEQAIEILRDARRALYGLLADQ